ncbi:hypothetical protein Halhy_2266 [Haliscomenobacter hydrossis DSM 1100]|uniref:Uncharacterized protein n=1 Tax=Haliscomenobacter hydrossis (strain ATCC 27775 / DSM 1100 / LMG 10767 / O) TaxID=760192 RepID=F4KU48_HALH1|nr:hypothetical protein Halhy_2266 [Haliscomenobacter hydrossis DSM 1100]
MLFAWVLVDSWVLQNPSDRPSRSKSTKNVALLLVQVVRDLYQYPCVYRGMRKALAKITDDLPSTV